MIADMAAMEDENMEKWLSRTGWEWLPDNFIECPLGEDQLREFYGVERAAEDAGVSLDIWEEQVALFQNTLTHPQPSHKRHRGGTQMKPAKPSTVRNKVKTIGQLVGFAVRHQGREASMSLVMEPQVLAKYIGFLTAKKLASSSIMLEVKELRAVVDFVQSRAWKWEKPWEAGQPEEVMLWLKCQHNKLKAGAPVMRKPGTTVTLWAAWSHQLQVWDDFIKLFEVGRGRCWRLVVACCMSTANCWFQEVSNTYHTVASRAPRPHPHPPTSCRRTK